MKAKCPIKLKLACNKIECFDNKQMPNVFSTEQINQNVQKTVSEKCV